MKMIFSILLILSAAVLSAQDIEPAEPDIVLPEVILQIDDLSVDVVDAGLPPEEELLPPERDFPLPEEEALQIEDPTAPAYPVESKQLTAPAKGYTLTAEGMLGLGSMNHIVSSVALYRLGDEPRFDMRFQHEMLDGLAGRAPGSGFDLRQDSLEGILKFHLGGVGVDLEGYLADEEQGLQEQGGAYISKIHRHGGALADLLFPLNDVFSLRTAMGSGFSTELLTGTTPTAFAEWRLNSEVELRYTRDKFWIGLNTRYGYRGWENGSELHRMGASALFAVDLPLDMQLEGSGGWFWSTPAGHLFPFELALAGSPINNLSFRLSGGLRIEELDLEDLFSQYPLVARPTDLRDNEVWFGDLALNLSLFRDLALLSSILFSANSGLPSPYRDPLNLPTGLDPVTGLFPIQQIEAFRLQTRFGAKWNLFSVLTLRGSLASEWLDRPGFTPLHGLLVEAEGSTSSAKAGGKASVLFQLGHTEFKDLRYSAWPLMDLSAFYRFSDVVSLVGEVEDLLSPLIKADRKPWAPYREPGLRGTIKIEITL